MSAVITVKQDVWKLRRALSRMVDKQVPFATARALTWTARDARDDLRDDLRDHFTIRNKRTEKGVQSRGAKKRDWPNQEATVGSRDEYMAMQSEGGVKDGKTGGRVGVPVRARLRKTSTTPRGKWPGKMAKKDRHFVIKTPRGAVAVYKRVGRGRKALALQWWMVRQVRVKKRWPISESVRRTVARKWASNAVRSLRMAIHLR